MVTPAKSQPFCDMRSQGHELRDQGLFCVPEESEVVCEHGVRFSRSRGSQCLSDGLRGEPSLHAGVSLLSSLVRAASGWEPARASVDWGDAVLWIAPNRRGPSDAASPLLVGRTAILLKQKV